LGVSQASLSMWKRTLLPREQADVEAELRRVYAENRELRMERDILKKAAVFFAKESS